METNVTNTDMPKLPAFLDRKNGAAARSIKADLKATTAKPLTGKQAAQAAAGVKVTEDKAKGTNGAPAALPTKDDTKTTPRLKHKPRGGKVERKVVGNGGKKTATTKTATTTTKAAKPEPTAKELEAAAKFAAQVKAHATKNEKREGKGWDKVLKWWDAKTVKELLVGVETLNGAIKRVRTAAGTM
jgi:hypothetical protein